MGKSKVAKKQSRLKKQKTRIYILAICIVAAVTLLTAAMYALYAKPMQLLSAQNAQVAALKAYIFENSNAEKRIDTDFYVVFLSVCDKLERALVFTGKGKTLDAAWNSADKQAAIAVKNKNLDVVWAKADIVNSTEEIQTVDLNKELVDSYYPYFFRKGIAFDKEFNTAFLEAEVNGNKMITYYTEGEMANKQIDYNSIRINLTNINHYRNTYYGKKELTRVPKNLITFTTIGFFCDENSNVYELYDQGLDYGRRIVDVVDDNVIEDAIFSASRYLYEMIQPNGEFIYGYFPIFDNQLTSYNILRHGSSIWSLINLYRLTLDDNLIPKLNAAIDYLIDGFIEYKEDGVAYVIERKADEIKLGGNAIAIIMLTEYMDVFHTDEYIELIRDLANGILDLEDLNSGTFYHVLNYPSYELKDVYRTVYYDGEATFALTRAYTYTRDEKYLDGARMAVENFIAQDYTRFRDHWVAYALNEITKYLPDIRYYEFALKNVADNLDRIHNQKTSYHTYLELLMISWQTYTRINESGLDMEYLDRFDVERFAQTIYHRARHMLNGFFYPEYAMYMKNPGKVVGAFFVRHDNYRVRVDDIQHFIGGYYYYTKYFNDIRPYLNESFLTEINNSSMSSSGIDIFEQDVAE